MGEEILTYSYRGGLVLVKSSLPTASHFTIIHCAELYPLKYNETCVYHMTCGILIQKAMSCKTLLTYNILSLAGGYA
jgi:hypothetical protein